MNEDTELLDRLEHAFEVAGHDFELLGALSAPRAIGVASKKQPDVILVNADLDGMDGFDFAKHLKKEELLKTHEVAPISDDLSRKLDEIVAAARKELANN